MKINDNRNMHNTNFCSGLNSRILIKEKLTSVNHTEKFFQTDFGIETNFIGNKSGALANKLCLNIFSTIFNKVGFKLNLPPAIFFYDTQNLINTEHSGNFCIPETSEVLKNDYPFAGRSIFFHKINNLETVDTYAERLYSIKETSSSHFLAPFIHEWVHSLQLDYIFRTFGYDGDCEYMKSVYGQKGSKSGLEILKSLGNKTLTDKENEIIYEELGKYSTLSQNQYLEVFSEGVTKFICNSLINCELKEDPANQLYKTSKEFQNIFYKVCTFK